MNLRETYNTIAEDWHKHHWRDDWWIEGTDTFVSFLKSGALVLDVECGGGVESKYLAEKGLQVIGIDFSEKMIEIAKREVPNGTFLVCDLGETEKLKQQFDGVFMQAVLLHVSRNDAVEALRNATATLKRGGYVYVAVKEKRDGKEEEVKQEDDLGYPYERFFSYFTKDEIESYMRQLEFEVVYSKKYRSGRVSWIQVIGRK